MKYIIVLGDGMADEPLVEFGGKTPLQMADKPAIDNLAKFYLDNGNLKQSEVFFKKELKCLEETNKANGIEYAYALNFLGRIYYSLSKFLDAEPFYNGALKIFRLKIPDNPDFPAIINNLALLYTDLGRFSEAEKLFKDAIALRKKMLGENHPEFAQSINGLGILFYNMGRFNDAENYYKTALKIIREKYSEKHISYAIYTNNLALLYNDMGRFEEAEKLYKKSINIFKIMNHFYVTACS